MQSMYKMGMDDAKKVPGFSNSAGQGNQCLSVDHLWPELVVAAHADEGWQEHHWSKHNRSYSHCEVGTGPRRGPATQLGRATGSGLHIVVVAVVVGAAAGVGVV